MMLKKKDLRLLDELLTPWFYVDCHPTVKSGGQPEEGQQKKIQTLSLKATSSQIVSRELYQLRRQRERQKSNTPLSHFPQCTLFVLPNFA